MRRGKMFLAQMLLSCILASSCARSPCSTAISTRETTQFSPPDFIVSYETLATGNHESVCVRVSQRPLWESSEPLKTFTEEILESARLFLDGKEIDRQLLAIFTFNWQKPIIRGDVVGVYGGDIEFCTSLKHIPTGIHRMNMQFSTLPEKEYSFTWEVLLCR